MVKRTEIVDAAVQVMRGGGPAAVTSVAVAARLGLTQSALYRYVRDVDELRTLAVERLLAELETDLTAAVVSTGIGDANSTETAVFALRLVEATARHAVAFEVVDRFRFADGDLGTGIRAMLERGREFTASVLERRWQQGHKGVDRPARLRVAARVHSGFFQEDVIATARLVRHGRVPGGRRALARTLAHRMDAGWRAFEVDVVDAGAQSTDVA